jgi:PAS domain S-box-containing protein
LVVAENAGLLPQPNYSVGITQWLNYTALFGITGGMVYYSNRKLGDALASAKHEIERRQEVEFESRKLNRAVEQSPLALVITDRLNRIEYANPRLEEITGYALAELLGRDARIINSGLTSAGTYREIWAAISSGGKWRGEFQNRKKDGELYWDEVSISGLSDENGQTTHFFGFMTDITERKRVDQEIQEIRKREIEVGSIIQRSLVIEVPEGIEGAWLAQYADPSQIVDGDFCSIHRFSKSCFEVLVGDAMGKGIQAALMGAGVITAYNRSLADLLIGDKNALLIPSPADIVNAIHRAMTPQLIAISSFATLALYRFDLDAGTLTYVNAGHTPGLLTRGPSTRPVAILGDNLPIGIMPEENYVQSSLAIGAYDSLTVFSDGITEAHNAQGEEFGIERLSDLIEAGNKANLLPATIMQALRGAQRRFIGGGPGADDLTAVMVCLHPRRSGLVRSAKDRVAPLQFCLPWNLEGLGRLRTQIMACAGNLPEDDANALTLASFEAATNIIRHARLLVGNATIACRITRESDALVVELIYPSESFTPPAQVNPDMSGGSEGGFGLFIIEQSVDSVEYASLMPDVSSVRLVKRATV